MKTIIDGGDYKEYQRVGTTLIRPILELEIHIGADNLRNSGVSISEADISNGSPKQGDMIAVNRSNSKDMWLISQEHFEKNYRVKE